MPFTPAELEAAIAQAMAGGPAAAGTSRAIVSHSLSLSNLTCVQDSLEPGKDEMILGAVATVTRVLADGTIDFKGTIIDPKDLGKFRKDDSKDFDPAKLIASFTNVETPAILSVHLVLAEDDWLGGVKPVLRDLLDGLENRLDKTQISAIVGGAAGLAAAVVPLAILISEGSMVTLAAVAWSLVLGGLIAVAAAAVAALLFAAAQLVRDEIFPVQSTSVALNAAGGLDAGTFGPTTLRSSRQVAIYDATVVWS